MAGRIALPDDPLARFLELAQALKEGKRWFDSWEGLRHAAVTLSTVPERPGGAATVASAMWEVAQVFKKRSGWFGPLNTGDRFHVAALVVREGVDPDEFYDSVNHGRELFRKAKLRRGGFYEVLAILVLRAQSSNKRLQSSQWTRFAAIFEALRADHRWLTGREDFPTIALLCGTTHPAERIRAELEVAYRWLAERGFKRGQELQTATHILHLAPEQRTGALDRFARIYEGFKAQGLRMTKGDYDEVALLAYLSATPQAIVKHTLRHRDAIRELEPRPAKQLAFTLASGTAFVDLLRKDAADLGPTRVARLLAVHGVLQAQQAAILAEQRAAAAAAG
jgi:hypothetical protein